MGWFGWERIMMLQHLSHLPTSPLLVSELEMWVMGCWADFVLILNWCFSWPPPSFVSIRDKSLFLFSFHVTYLHSTLTGGYPLHPISLPRPYITPILVQPILIRRPGPVSPGYSPVLAGISNCVWAMWQVSSIVFIISGQTSCDWYQPLGHTQS